MKESLLETIIPVSFNPRNKYEWRVTGKITESQILTGTTQLTDKQVNCSVGRKYLRKGAGQQKVIPDIGIFKNF